MASYCNRAVGKTSIAKRFIENTFSPDYEVTISGAYFQSEMTLENGATIKFHIWDTAGEERFRSIAHNYYKEAVGAILVFDISEISSLDGIVYWIKDLENHTNIANMALALAANKCDKSPENEFVIPQGKKFAKDNDMIFKETSALSGSGIQDLFKTLAEIIAKKNISEDH